MSRNHSGSGGLFHIFFIAAVFFMLGGALWGAYGNLCKATIDAAQQRAISRGVVGVEAAKQLIKP